MLKGTVTYSDIDGNITATTVVNILQEWILTTDGGDLSKSCPTRTNWLINSTCEAFPVDSYLIKQIIGYISGSFIGGLITGLLISVLTTFIWLR